MIDSQDSCIFYFLSPVPESRANHVKKSSCLKQFHASAVGSGSEYYEQKSYTLKVFLENQITHDIFKFAYNEY